MTSSIVEREKKGDAEVGREENDQKEPKKKLSKFALARLAK